MSNQQDKRTASQRIDDLERGLMGIYQTADNMARDLMLSKDAIKLLGNKLQSVVQLLTAGTAVNDDNVSAKMIENNIAELAEKVKGLVDQGVLAPATEVTDTSFLVGREVNDEGKIANPRLQFALNALGEELRNKFKAAKIGDIITLQEGKLKFELQELYSIQVPKPPEAAPADAPAAEAAPAAQAPDAPAPAPADAPAAPAPDADASAQTPPTPQADAAQSSNDASAQAAPAQSGSGS